MDLEKNLNPAFLAGTYDLKGKGLGVFCEDVASIYRWQWETWHTEACMRYEYDAEEQFGLCGGQVNKRHLGIAPKLRSTQN